MAKFWQAVHIRGQQTIGVWGTFGPFPAGHTVNFRVRATNSAGTTDSAVQAISLSTIPVP